MVAPSVSKGDLKRFGGVFFVHFAITWSNSVLTWRLILEPSNPTSAALFGLNGLLLGLVLCLNLFDFRCALLLASIKLFSKLKVPII